MLITLSRLPFTPRLERDPPFYPVMPKGFGFAWSNLETNFHFQRSCSRFAGSGAGVILLAPGVYSIAILSLRRNADFGRRPPKVLRIRARQ
jgi:hypothetical protein